MGAFDCDVTVQPIEQAWRLLRQHGVVLLRRVFPATDIQRLAETADRAYAWAGTGGFDALSEFDRAQLNAHAMIIDHLSVADVPARRWLAEPVRDLAAMALGAPVTVAHWSFWRRVEPDDVEEGTAYKLPFHQDQRILGKPLINLWIPLVGAGDDAPGLEVVAQRLPGLEPTIAADTNIYGKSGVQIATEHVTTAYASALVRPVLAPGDALMFYGTTIHRTHIAEGMTKRRDSIDLRFVKA